MAGKVSDEQFFELEKKMKRYETIIGAMSEEERCTPDILCRQGGKKELVLEASRRKEDLAKRSGYTSKEVLNTFNQLFVNTFFFKILFYLF